MFSSNSSQVADNKLFSEDVFSTYVYTGNGSTQTITNGIDLSGKGGMVWIKQRNGSSASHHLFDTSRGTGKILFSNSDSGQLTDNTTLTAFNSNGFSLGGQVQVNTSGLNFASWTFRKAPKFFDVVTFTTNSSGGATFSHALGSTPGCIFIKNTAISEQWDVWHTSLGNNQLLFLNSTNATYALTGWCVPNSTQVSFPDGTFTVSSTYVAYLFAHDTTSDGIIQCGSYTVPSSVSSVDISLGWEPQWVLIKNTNISGNAYTGWGVFDNMRGVATNAADVPLLANSSTAENGTYNSNTTDYVDFGSTGFTVKPETLTAANGGGHSYIYIAIRRGPMRTPTSGTSVFSPVAITPNINEPIITNFPVDLSINGVRTGTTTKYFQDRLRGGTTSSYRFLEPDTTNAETSGSSIGIGFDNNTGISRNSWWTSSSSIWWSFRRAPSFFDEVCYTGTGVAGRTVSHNLGVAPELMIVKSRDNTSGAGWAVYPPMGNSDRYLFLNLDMEARSNAVFWNSTAPTSSLFTVGDSFHVNNSGSTYVAYLFASCPGVSKVGSYTGNGSSQTINCGFAAGARFVMIKRTDSTGDWYVWDTARGIVSGNDPHLSLNSTAAEVTTDDSVDTDSSGFVVNQLSATNINVSSATYIYLAVA